MENIKKITDNVWKINAGSNVYILLNEKIIIDTGNRDFRDILINSLKKIINPEKIEKVFFTHLHYDHIGNFDLFSNAKFYASEEEINSLKKDKLAAILNKDMAERFNAKLNRLSDFDGFKIIKTPGHTIGSICILYKNILFSGDTLFPDEQVGRVDLPTSMPDKLKESLNKISKLRFKILAPGHDY